MVVMTVPVIVAMTFFIIVVKLLRHKSAAAEVLCVDHPTQAGLVVLER